MIAVIAMVTDHLAWAFVDFWSPLGQIMHIIGRLTIPIMCFFIAEGYKNTSDRRKYFERLAAFAVVSIIPFYLFFHEEYGYRQNMIFDHTLSLLILIVLERRTLKKWQKAVLVTLLFAVSILIGGWPVTPALFTLAFYYGRTFKEKAKWFIIINVVTFFAVSAMAFARDSVYFAMVNWTWYDRAYLLGFMLALPVLYLYNGERGKAIFGRRFLYGFYPAHFLILAFIKYMTAGDADLYTVYLWFHIICLLIVFAMLIGVLKARAGRMQLAVVMFLIFEGVYILGFVAQLLSSDVETLYMLAAVQYFGELFMLIAFLVVASECGRIRIPLFIYIAHTLAAFALIYTILISPQNGFFYSDIIVTYLEGHIKPEYIHETGYTLSVVFIGVVVAEIFFIMVNSLINGTKIEKRRMEMLFATLMYIWIPYAITLTGITRGYEIPGLGVVCAAMILTVCFYRYGALDLVSAASVNALEKAEEGVLIIDDRLVVTFSNSLAETIVGRKGLISANAKKYPAIKKILARELTEIERDGRVYEVRVDEIKHTSYIQGYTIWFIDATKHKEQLDESEFKANHDALTGIYNRRHFEELVDREIENGNLGALVISDMDNFKAVNDTFGHNRGDKVLTDYADILKAFPEDILFPCRIGGDEFMFYIKNMTDPSEVSKLVEDVMERFRHKFRKDEIMCTLSIGIVINEDPGNLKDFKTLYREADKKLYTAKEKGKNTYIL